MAAGNASLGTIRGKIQIDYDGAGVAKASSDVDNLDNKGKNSKATWDKTSKGMAVAGGVIAAGFALAINSAADFEKGLSDIQAVTGATTSELEIVRQKALQLGKDTAFSASEAATAMNELAKAGLSIPDIMNGAADATVALAAAGGVSLPEAATIAANAMNQFALSAKDMPRIADLIAGAANASAIDVSDLGMSIAQAGAVAHLAGLSFDDTAAAIALMGNAGIKGSDAGTSLKTLLQNLIPVTKDQIALSQKLGLITKDGGNAFFDASGKVKSLADISQVLQNALKGMTKEQQLATLQTLFGSDAIRGAAILAGNGAVGFNKMSEAMAKVKAADVAAVKMNNLRGQIEQFKGSVETGAIQVGSALIPQLTKLAKFVTGLANSFANLSPSTQGLIIQIAGGVGAFFLMGAAIIKLVNFFQQLAKIMKIMQAWQLIAKAMAVATKVWTAAQWLLNIALNANPIGLIVVAILIVIAVIALLWTHSAAFRSFFISVWNSIWSFLKTIGAWFAGPFANFFVGVWHVIVDAFNAIKNPVMAVFNFIKQGILGWWSIISAVIGFFAPLFQAAFGLIVSIIKLAWAIITAVIQVAVTLIGALISFVMNAIVASWNFWWGLIMGVIKAVWGFIGPYVMAAIQIMVNFVMGVVNTLVSWWNSAWNFVKGIITGVWSFIGPYVIATIQVMVNTVMAVINGVVNFFVGAWNSVKNTSVAVWNSISSFFVGLWNSIVAIFRDAVNRVTAVINGIKAFVDKIRDFFNQLKAAASGGVGSLIAFVTEIPGRIIRAIGNLGSSLVQKGRDLIQGLINGISGMAGRIRDALIGLLPGPLRQFASMLGLASPSKLFRKWGLWTIQGYINGINAMQDRLRRTMGVVSAVTTTPMVITGNAVLGGSGGNSAASGAASGTATRPTTTVTTGPTYVSLNVDGKELGKAAVLDERRVADASAAGTQERNWLSPGRAVTV